MTKISFFLICFVVIGVMRAIALLSFKYSDDIYRYKKMLKENLASIKEYRDKRKAKKQMQIKAKNKG